MKERTYVVRDREVYLQDFEGINEFADYVREMPIAEAWLNDSSVKMLSSNEDYSDPSWHGARNFAEAETGLRNGKNVREIARSRAASLVTERRAFARGVSGGAPIVPAYLTGCPRSMMTLRPQKERKMIRVFVDCSMPSGVEGSEMTAAGEKVVAMLAKLDNVVNYDLVAGCVVTGSGKITGFGITIKTADKPFSASRVSFCLTSPAFRRVFGFLWNGKNVNVPYMWSMGRSLTWEDMSLYKEVMRTHFKDTVVIPLCQIARKQNERGTLIRRSNAEAEAYIKNIFKEVGIKL